MNWSNTGQSESKACLVHIPTPPPEGLLLTAVSVVLHALCAHANLPTRISSWVRFEANTGSYDLCCLAPCTKNNGKIRYAGDCLLPLWVLNKDKLYFTNSGRSIPHAVMDFVFHTEPLCCLWFSVGWDDSKPFLRTQGCFSVFPRSLPALSDPFCRQLRVSLSHTCHGKWGSLWQVMVPIGWPTHPSSKWEVQDPGNTLSPRKTRTVSGPGWGSVYNPFLGAQSVPPEPSRVFILNALCAHNRMVTFVTGIYLEMRSQAGTPVHCLTSWAQLWTAREAPSLEFFFKCSPADLQLLCVMWALRSRTGVWELSHPTRNPPGNWEKAEAEGRDWVLPSPEAHKKWWGVTPHPPPRDLAPAHLGGWDTLQLWSLQHIRRAEREAPGHLAHNPCALAIRSPQQPRVPRSATTTSTQSHKHLPA